MFYDEFLASSEDYINNKLKNDRIDYKPIVCLETRMVYNCITLASTILNIQPSSIINCCKNKQKTAGCLHFMYEHDYLKQDEEYIKNKLLQTVGHNKLVRCEELDLIFTVKEASKFINKSKSTIKACCQGRLKTAGGYSWEYYG